MEKSTLILYHAHCYDGFGAAWVAWQRFQDDAEYVPVSYGHEVPRINGYTNLHILDFSYPRETLLQWREQLPGDLWVVDHHKTAEEDLRGLPFVKFDMAHSGATLAFNHFFPERQDMPELLRYVEDRDLWRFTLPHSREVSAWLHSHPMDFEVWCELTRTLRNDQRAVVAEGAAICRFQHQQVEQMCQHVRWRELAGCRIPYVNATLFQSEVGHALCERFPEAPFVACYLDRADGKRQWSLRGRGTFDVSAIAKQLGGGGHYSAAGYTEDLL